MLPIWHPSIKLMVDRRSLVTSPASLMSYATALFFAVVLLVRNFRKLIKSGRTEELFLDEYGSPMGKPLDGSILSTNTMDTAQCHGIDGEHGIDVVEEKEEEVDSDIECPIQQSYSEGIGFEELPALDQRRRMAMMLHRNHRDNTLMPREEQHRKSSIITYKEKKNTKLRTKWKQTFAKRLRSDLSTGEAVVCILYVIVNLIALLASPTYGFNVGFGSLSAGNTLFLVITATRNSVLTWIVGITFDQVLVYHRFIGRLTIALSLIHSIFYIDHIIERTSDQVTITGLAALGCGIIIALSSVNYFRRKFFNVFFWSHYSFLGFIVGMYLHAPGARPFILSSIVCYGGDKLLQMIWTQLPRKTTVMEKVGDNTAHVQFTKTPIATLLGRHKVGQYVFVNFPELSLNEWHPFSVASASNDPHIDLYIRALGDHTKKIVEYSEKCAAENKPALIRSDGPYGDLSFNYRRYGSLVLVGGGIGITPLISILKDIYSDSGAARKNKPSHCIRQVCLVWVMPRASEASLFLDLLNQFHENSLSDPLLPSLKLSIHITRDDGFVTGQQVSYSRPDFDAVMNDCIENRAEGSRSILCYACGPERMVHQLWDASTKKNTKHLRCDFYHETFEF
jgi:predicted ferric reductase